MYYAKAMYQGGTIVCADDANYSSYLDDGLLCLVCDEEVHLRSGYERRPHFAHHKAVALGSMECPLRVTGYSDSWSGLTPEGRGQRRELFQKHFLKMIASSDSEFFKKIEITNYRITSKLLKYLTEQCIHFFYNHKSNFIFECRSLPETSYDNKLVLQRLIASEAIAYLCVTSSRTLLERLFHYSIYIYFDCSYSVWDNFVNQTQTYDICNILKNIIIETHWLSTFYSQSRNTTNSNKSDWLTIAIQNYIETENESSAPFNLDGKTYKLKFQGATIKLLTKQVVGFGYEPIWCYRPITTIACLTDYHIDSVSSGIMVDWKFIDESYCMWVYEQLKTKIEDFIKSKQKNKNTLLNTNLIEWEHIEELEEKRLEKEKELERKRIEQEKEIAKQKIELVSWQEQVKQKLEEFLNTELNKVPAHEIVHCLLCQCSVKKINLRKHVINVHLKNR